MNEWADQRKRISSFLLSEPELTGQLCFVHCALCSREHDAGKLALNTVHYNSNVVVVEQVAISNGHQSS